MLKNMLQDLMSKFKVGGVPQINPTAMDASFAHRRNRQMLSLGGILSKMSRKLLAKHKKDNVVKVLKKEVDKADKKLKEAREEFEYARDEFYEDGSMEGYDFDPSGMELEMLYQTQNERQKLAFQLERRLYDLEKKENPDVEYFVKERDFMEDIDPEERRPGYIDRLDREMDPNNPENYPNDPFGDDIPFAEGERVGYASGSDVDFGEPLQPRLDAEKGFSEADANLGVDIDKSLSQLLNAPTEKDVDSGIDLIYRNASKNSYFNEQFERDDLYMRLNQLRQQVNQRVQKYSGGSMASKNTWTKTPIEKRKMYQEGSDVDLQMKDMMEGPTHTMPDGTVMPGATHGEYEAMMPEEGMVPDEQMENDYTDFIINEALEPEEEEYLMNVLSQDDQLSVIVDKVIDTASEFSGAGEVDGPGTPVSDSIPARLSDGEFVMTAKATDAIGADTLDELMALAEQEADSGRQMKAIGGEAKSEVEKLSSTVVEEDPIKLKNKEVMRAMDPRLSLFAS